MDVYPRSKTWPYAAVVALLFCLAAWYPDWWTARARKARRGGLDANRAVSSERAGNASDIGRPERDTSMDWVEPWTLPLRPPVARRIAVSPEEAFAETAEPSGTARFPRDAVVDSDESIQGARRRAFARNERTRDVSDSSVPTPLDVGPIEPPGVRRDLPLPLDVTPADLDGLSGSLPAEQRSLNRSLQSGADSTVPLASTWPRPVALWEMIGQFNAESSQVAKWSSEVQETLTALHTIPMLEDPRSTDVFDRMDDLAARCPDLEIYLSDANRRQLRRIRYGLARRASVWRQVHRLSQQQAATPQSVRVVEVEPVLVEVETRLAARPYGETWRRYLMLDQLTRIATETWVTDPSVRYTVAREVLRRMTDSKLTREQKYELQDPAIQHLRRKLEDWAEAPIDLLTLVAALEQFELVRSAAVAAQVVDQMQSLTYSRHGASGELFDALDRHYRNANVRFSISAQLLNDLLPVLQPQDRTVRERILGADVRGQNRTWTELQLRLIDDAERLRLVIQADGQSRSRTISTKGPVRLLTHDQSRFQADKELLVSPEGIFTYRATAQAAGRSTLLNLETNYDQIPLVGWLVRQVALDQHDDQRPLVRAEIRQRITRLAQQELDNSIHSRLRGIEDRLDRAILNPLRDLELDPTTMEMRTIEQRLVMRYRLAADSQLAACTPRPRGTTDNVLSIQLHESLANNLLAQAKLDDRRVELELLMKELSDKLHIQRQDIHEEIPPDVTIHLGHDRPIQFEFDDERVLVTVRIKELTTPRRSWRNFIVRGRYRPDVSPTHVDLQRDGGIELISEQLGFRDQVALRGIFTKVMTRDHRLNILRGRFISDSRLNKLGVTQFVARDGWIGLSIAPLQRDQVATAGR